MQTDPNINAERIQGHLELSVGTTASAPLRFNIGPLKTSPVVGDLMFNSGRLILFNGSYSQIAFTSDITGGGSTGSGATGPQGTQGPIGPQGFQGSTGTQGPQGRTGSNGATGSQGPQGTQGSAGAGGVVSVSGVSNRTTSTGGANPVIDIAPTYVGQTTIEILSANIHTGGWQASSIHTNYTDAKIKGTISNSQIAVCNGTTNTIYGTDVFKFEQSLTQLTLLGGVRFGILPLVSVAFYTPTESDYTIISQSNFAGNTTINLPPAVSSLVGKIYNIKNLTINPSEFVEIKPDGADTIDNGVSYFLDQFGSVTIQCDGDNWFILSSHGSTHF